MSQSNTDIYVLNAVNAATNTSIMHCLNITALKELSNTIKEANRASNAQSRSSGLAAILPGTGANPYFDGRNVTRFLERFDRLQELYYPEENEYEKIQRLCHNVSDELATRVKFIAENCSSDWESFTTRLLRAYRQQDPTQTKASHRYLRELSSLKHEEPREILEYCYDFMTASDLIPDDELDGPIRKKFFLRGLHSDEHEPAERLCRMVARGPEAITVREFRSAMLFFTFDMERSVDDEEVPRKRQRLQ
jgi:hypothetical protein